MIFRIYVEKKEALRNKEKKLLKDAQDLYGLASLKKIRILNRYDIELKDKKIFDQAKNIVFSEPMVDLTYDSLEEACKEDPADYILGVEALPGQFDQRADSCSQCIQMLSSSKRPQVKTALIYLCYGDLKEEDKDRLQKVLINPVETRQASLEKKESLAMPIDEPKPIAILDHFRSFSASQLEELLQDLNLAMDEKDIALIQGYFQEIKRDPSLAEIKILDTYWSDHCRHTTFHTEIDEVKFYDDLLEKTYQDYLKTREALGRTKPISFMDIGTIVAKYLQKEGKLDGLDVSKEINACTVKIKIEVDGKKEDWLLLFKNETHNHPTEIEPFGGAATCIGGAIRDPLSGRAYVYGSMRLTGAGNPLESLDQTLEGKLPQYKICKEACHGFSSYGNQIGIATGQVNEIYHPNYVAKRMEVGAVIGAIPASHVRREEPSPRDVILLIGGKTGRDGIGGATGSSKAHKVESSETAGAEVQKGNAPEERKIQRFFRNSQVLSMIKRCNDFGAGGVSVAIGELAEGVLIDLDLVPKKYEGLDGLELAISESQERMAVCIEKKNLSSFLALAKEENLEATMVAEVTEKKKLRMVWQGQLIVDLDRSFLDENGAKRHIKIEVPSYQPKKDGLIQASEDFASSMEGLVNTLNGASQRGLGENFDSTIGKGTVLMPFGGKYQRTPSKAMVHKISMVEKDTENVSFMAYGFNPFLSTSSPYHAAYYAVVESLSKLVASGADLKECYLSFQEYFQKLGQDPIRWGQPLAALLGAFQAQMDFEVAAIGGKDSMSGSFEDIDVPPSLISFAVTTGKTSEVLSPEFKENDSFVYLLSPKVSENDLIEKDSLKALFQFFNEKNKEGKILAASTPAMGGIAQAIFEMSIGNEIGFSYENIPLEELFKLSYGSLILETKEEINTIDREFPFLINKLGETKEEKTIAYKKESLDLNKLISIYEGKFEKLYPLRAPEEEISNLVMEKTERSILKSPFPVDHPRVLIPVFPGTNTEYDAAKYVRDAGCDPHIFIIQNQTSQDMQESIENFVGQVEKAHVLFLPGGFSGGDEPDGSAKFITSFMQNPSIAQAIEDLIHTRKGLVLGICNGFQALIKLGLLPYGHITKAQPDAPTLTANKIGHHRSKMVDIKVSSLNSPWLSLVDKNTIYKTPISHGEGRLIANEKTIAELAKNGQIACQYVDLEGQPTMDSHFNPNGSIYAIEGLLAAEGRIFGKMGHTERAGKNLYKNVPGLYDLRLFEACKLYFQEEK